MASARASRPWAEVKNEAQWRERRLARPRRRDAQEVIKQRQTGERAEDKRSRESEGRPSIRA